MTRHLPTLSRLNDPAGPRLPTDSLPLRQPPSGLPACLRCGLLALPTAQASQAKRSPPTCVESPSPFSAALRLPSTQRSPCLSCCATRPRRTAVRFATSWRRRSSRGPRATRLGHDRLLGRLRTHCSACACHGEAETTTPSRRSVRFCPTWVQAVARPASRRLLARRPVRLPLPPTRRTRPTRSGTARRCCVRSRWPLTRRCRRCCRCRCHTPTPRSAPS
mmetsp:Transcript_16713/g.52236  ORF Transcript_16713/g.52236 Transcript_16713/m.52236 type:complete len:220 (-) Transcript_16713:1608-2267(-)